MSDAPDPGLLSAMLDSWDRNNTIMVNLLRVLPEGGLEARATADSPCVAQLLTHIHYVRLVFVLEDAPELAGRMPEEEWADERDRERIAQMLHDSSIAVREAVRSRLASGRAMDRHYDHPILLLQHMLWHEGYHHGQIKLALKLAGLGLPDEIAGPVTWSVWIQKGAGRQEAPMSSTSIGETESTADREFVHSRLLDAPAERVFRAFADPVQLARWWGPEGFTNTFEVFDLRPGGTWRFVMHGPNGTDYPNESVFHEVLEPRRVVFEHLTAPHFFITITFTPQANGTLVGWRQVFDSAAERDRLAKLVTAANEQNLDRLAAEVLNVG